MSAWRYVPEFEVVDLDLLIIDYIAIYPEFRGLRIAESAIHRTIDIFGTGCGLVACKPWPLQFTPSVADDQERIEKTCITERKQRRGHSEAEILLVTARVLAARQHRNLSASSPGCK